MGKFLPALMVVLLSACQAQEKNVESVPTDPSKGYSVLLAQCTQCHGVPHPASRTHSQWLDIVARMDKKIQFTGRAGLTYQQREDLMQYLGEHAKSD